MACCNPSNLGAFAFHHRFPGQHLDEATGLFHNWYRDYHPGLGRYVQSDPLGLIDGFSTYAYVGSGPMMGKDPYGLMKVQAYQNRGRGRGWETEYEITFQPISPKSFASLNYFGKQLNRMDSLLSFLDTKGVGPKEPYKTFFECAELDYEIQKYYERKGHKNGDRLSKEEAEAFLNSAFRRFPEMKNLYPTPSEMLKNAEHNSKNHWFYSFFGDSSFY